MKRCPRCKGSFEDGLTHCPDDGAELVERLPSKDPFVGRVLAGRYEVLELLGRGGFGVVYKVRDRKLDDVVAVKVFDRRRFTDEEAHQAIQRFRREGVVLRRVGKRTNNIVIVYDFDEDEEEDLFYFTMDYVEGTTLTEILAKEGALPLPRVLDLGLQLCQALKAAHSQGIVHRDLKLENVMVTRDGDREVVKVLDFGIAKMVGSQSLTNLAMGVPGTAGFAPPEQLQRPQDIDHRTDLFALGVVLYGLVTGHGPWSGEPISEPTSSEKIWELIRGSLEDAPIPIKEWRSDVPKPLDTLICKLLEKDQARRVQSAELVEEELKKVRRLLTGRPETGKTLGPADAFRAVARRAGVPPAAFVGGLLAVLAIVMVAVKLVTGLTPSIPLEEFDEAAGEGRILETRIHGHRMDAVLRRDDGSVDDVTVSLDGVWIQELARRIQDAAVPLRMDGEGGVTVRAVASSGPSGAPSGQGGTGPQTSAGQDPSTLPPAPGAALFLEGPGDACAPCQIGQEARLQAGWYGVRASGDEWTLDGLTLRDPDGGFPDEGIEPYQATLFVPEDATLEIFATFVPTETRVVLTRAGEALAADDPEEAIPLVEEVLAESPEHPWARALRDSVLLAAAQARAAADSASVMAAREATGAGSGGRTGADTPPTARPTSPGEGARQGVTTPPTGAGDVSAGGVTVAGDSLRPAAQRLAGDSAAPAAVSPSGEPTLTPVFRSPGDSAGAAGLPPSEAAPAARLDRAPLSASDLVLQTFRFADDAFHLQGRFTAAGPGDATLCVASTFMNTGEDGAPFSDADGSFALNGQVAVTQEITPGRVPETAGVDFTLPVAQLHVERGTLRVQAVTRIWPGRCDAANTAAAPLAEASTAPICIVRYPAGWGICRGS